MWTDYYSSRTQKASQALGYAYNCYQNQSTSKTRDCNVYTKTALAYTKDTNAGCPFDGQMCLKPDGNLLLDSGMLDSHDDFGLNSGPRFQFHVSRQCAPVATKNFTDIFIEADGSQWMRYKYGRSSNLTGSQDFVYKLPYNSTKRPVEYQELMTGPDYTITS